MQNSSLSSPTSNSIVAKLLEVDADLAATEVELTLQLQSVREKRHSLTNVIGLFSPVDTAAPTPVAAVVEEQAKPTPQEVAAPELDEATSEPTTESTVAPPLQKRPGKKNPSPTNSKSNKKSAPTKEASKQADTWQQYVIGEFSNAPLAEAVAQVMQQHSEQVLEITAILDAIFVQEIPKELRSKARERVSNVLSVGAKKGKWYRGLTGKYSMSKAAVVDNLIE